MPTSLISVLRWTLRVAGLTCFALAVVGGAKVALAGVTATSLAAFVAAPLVLAAVFFLGSRFKPDTQLALLLSLFAAGVAVYGAETYLHIEKARGADTVSLAVEKKYGRPFDRRSAAAVIAELRARGTDAYPAYAVKFLKTPLGADGSAFMPFSSIGNTVTVHCNESGRYRIYKSDEFGFVNPPGLWRSGAIDIAAVGDSFVHGSCVENDLVSGIRRVYPRTLNAGYGGLGPLVEYAILLEYLAPERPKLVLWFFYENDLNNLLIEMRNPIYRAYLEEGRILGVREKQPIVDAAVRDYMREKFAAKLAEQEKPGLNPIDILLLRKLRQHLRLKAGGEMDPDRTDDTWMQALPDLGRVMAAAKAKTESWDGKLVFIYLPSINHYVPHGADSPEVKLHRPVIEAIDKVGLPILDMTPAFAAERDAPARYWHFEGSHYNEDGYAFVAQAVLKFLDEKNLRPH